MARRFPVIVVLATLWLALPAASLIDPLPPGSMPDDPRYAPQNCPAECLPITGQWNLFSTVPTTPPAPHATGISADLAWQTTVGRPDVVIAVLDSGVNYDHEDLRNKIWLNRGELPVPVGPCCLPPVGDVHDCNADGVFSVEDYVCDSAVSDTNGSGALDRGDLRVFADGLDTDGNGYVDDLSGFDTDDDDGDEFDHRYFGHGTGRAGIAAPETDNGLGVAGVCPNCPLMNVRIDDTFVCSSEGVAKGAIFAVDGGASVINMALGMLNSSTLLRGAFDYATTKNVLAVNASANEFSFHGNFASVFDDVMTIGGVTANDRSGPTTWLQKANFSNYGAHLNVVTPTEVPGAGQGRNGMDPDNARYGSSGSGTSSAVPHAAGIAGLVFSRARDLIALGTLDVSGLSLPDVSAQEVRQIIDRTADDVTPLDGTDYPVSVGWDKWTGYGRANAAAAVALVAATTMPPEADINGPEWYTLNTGVVDVQFYANARWASDFDYLLEVGLGAEPETFEVLASGTSEPADPGRSSADRVSNLSVAWDTTGLAGGFYTLRLRVTDDLGNLGEDRMGVWVRHADPDDLAAFPRFFEGSFEALATALVDLDGNGTREIVMVGGNGEVHAVQIDGSELSGFPVHTDLPRNLPLATSDAFDGDPTNGEVTLSYASVTGGLAVGDLDGDGEQEIVAGALDGQLYCWHGDASVCAGFPVSTDPGTSRDQYAPYAQIPNQSRGEAVGSTPSLGDLDGDGSLEITAGSADQKLYVWRADGSRFAPFPIVLFDAETVPGPSEFAPVSIASSPSIVDLEGDGQAEIVAATNETYGPSIGGTGRAYVVRADGSIADGWPIRPSSLQISAVPQVAEGIGTSPAMADVDGDGTLEIAIQPFFGTPTIYKADGTVFRAMQTTPFGTTGAGGDLDETTPEGGPARASDQPGSFYTGVGSFGDLDGDGSLDYLAPTLGFGIAGQVLNGSGTRVDFDHLLSAWSAAAGTYLDAFPRVMEDWQFFAGAAVADVSGDGMREAVATSGGYFVHAFDATGQEPPGWPKLTGAWGTATPSLGDLDGDGLLEVVQPTRLGGLFVWHTAGETCQTGTWRKFKHDEWNSGVFGLETQAIGAIDDFTARLSDRNNRVLEWTAVGGSGGCGQIAGYEVRVSDRPITSENYPAATLVDLDPDGEVRPPGVSEIRGVMARQVPEDDDDDDDDDDDEHLTELERLCGAFPPPADDEKPLETALYYAIRPVDQHCTPGPIASDDVLTIRKVRAKRDKQGRVDLLVEVRLPVKRDVLDLPADTLLRIVQNDETLLEFSVPASAFTSSTEKVRFQDKSGTTVPGLRRLLYKGNRRTTVVARTVKLDLPGLVAGPLAVEYQIGDRPFDDTVDLVEKGKRLKYPE